MATESNIRYEIHGYDEARGCYRIVEKRGIEDVYLYDGYPSGNVMHCYPRRPLSFNVKKRERKKMMLGADEIKKIF